jgi:hypothetical protein
MVLQVIKSAERMLHLCTCLHIQSVRGFASVELAESSPRLRAVHQLVSAYSTAHACIRKLMRIPQALLMPIGIVQEVFTVP